MLILGQLFIAGAFVAAILFLWVETLFWNARNPAPWR